LSLEFLKLSTGLFDMAGLRRLFASLVTGFELPILHPRENLRKVGSISGVGGEVLLDGCDGCNSVSIDIRGTYTVMAFELSGTINGTDFIPIPLVPKDPNQLKSVISAIPAAATGAWEADIAAYSAIRLRNTNASTPTGTAAIVMVASNAPLSRMVVRDASFRCPTVTAAVGVAATLTLASPGAGLRHYLTRITIDRINGTATALTPSVAALNATTTNIPDSLALSIPQDALAPGTIAPIDKDFSARPIATSFQNTSTTITCSAIPGVIWRITVFYFVAP
jgi:hypothetical protein